jgi:hypothetical protein
MIPLQYFSSLGIRFRTGQELDSLIEQAPLGDASQSLAALFQFVRRVKAKDWAGTGPLEVVATPNSPELSGLLLNILFEIQQATPDCLEVLSNHASTAIYEYVSYQLIEICLGVGSVCAPQATRLLHILGKMTLHTDPWL